MAVHQLVPLPILYKRSGAAEAWPDGHGEARNYCSAEQPPEVPIIQMTLVGRVGPLES